MKAIYTRFKVLATVLFAIAAASGCQRAERQQATESKVAGRDFVVIEGALLIDGTGGAPIADSALVIERDRVVQVGRRGQVRYPEGARIIDAKGKTIIPGLINLHGHVGLTKGLEQSEKNYTRENIISQLEQYAWYGVTAVLSLGSDRSLIYRIRDEQRQGKLGGARVFTAGRGFGVKKGYPPQLADETEGPYRPETPEQARGYVRELAARRVDMVKIWVDDHFGTLPKMKPEIYAATIDEAHKNGLRVMAHLFYLEDAKRLVDAGLDGMAHSVRDREIDDELISKLKEKGTFAVATLTRDESTFIYAESPEFLDDPFFRAKVPVSLIDAVRGDAYVKRIKSSPDYTRLKPAFEMAKRNLKKLYDAGVKIALGTDTGPPARFQGYFEHRELELMASLGIPAAEIIRIATKNSAEALGAGGLLGTIEAGKQADLVVLDANPLDDIRNTRKISAVWIAGKEVDRK